MNAGELEAAREAAWRDYDHANRAIPDCEHVRAWRQQIAEARTKHQVAIRAHRKALAAQEKAEAATVEPEPVPVTPRPAPVAPATTPAPDVQESLFEVGKAA